MKQLRQYIRQIFLEDKSSFIQELNGDPIWDEGATDYIDYKEETFYYLSIKHPGAYI